ncbi:MAG: 6,7-dimethyl-8-ribityllumazine synthase [Rhizobiaceae bacterium]
MEKAIAEPLSAQLAEARIAFVQSCWHKVIVDQCRISFVSEIERAGVAPAQIDFFEVPGAFEIPLHAKLLARSGRYDAIVAAGFIVDGGIYRHEFVAGAVIDALIRIQLDTEVPVLSAVLTPQQFHDHETHESFFMSHMFIKGTEAASACVATIANVAHVRAVAVSQTATRPLDGLVAG